MAGKQGLASASKTTLERVRRAMRLGHTAYRRRTAPAAARPWVGRERYRDRLIAEQAAAGETLAAIGRMFGISRERVRQVLERDSVA